jgi:hypothetical protein
LFYEDIKEGKEKITSEETLVDFFIMRNIITIENDFTEEKKTRIVLKKNRYIKSTPVKRYYTYLYNARKAISWVFFSEV